MDVERTIEFILEMQARVWAAQEQEKIAFAEMRENQIQLQKFQLRQEAAQAQREAAQAQREAAQAEREAAQAAAQAHSEITNQLLRERIATALVNMIDNMEASDKKLTLRMNEIAVAHKVLEEQVSEFAKETRTRLNRVENDVDDLRQSGR